MHILDSVINNIETRIEDIINKSREIPEPSFQEFHSAYGWILLESWIAWRTLRFLLREMEISESIQKKWFQTPSSFTATQIRAVWQFSNGAEEYILRETGKRNLKDLIDQTVEAKRNSSAHFSGKCEILGSDINDIKRIFNSLSRVFLLYENRAFINRLCMDLQSKGYEEFVIQNSNHDELSVEKFEEILNSFINGDEYTLMCTKENNKFKISFQSLGCKIGWFDVAKSEWRISDLISKEGRPYKFLENKGYYQNIESFECLAVEYWEKSVEV